jgi:hypothetical protein
VPGLFVALFGTAPQYGVESQAQEGSNHGQNDDFDSHKLCPVSRQSAFGIVPTEVRQMREV